MPLKSWQPDFNHPFLIRNYFCLRSNNFSPFSFTESVKTSNFKSYMDLNLMSAFFTFLFCGLLQISSKWIFSEWMNEWMSSWCHSHLIHILWHVQTSYTWPFFLQLIYPAFEILSLSVNFCMIPQLSDKAMLSLVPILCLFYFVPDF